MRAQANREELIYFVIFGSHGGIFAPSFFEFKNMTLDTLNKCIPYTIHVMRIFDGRGAMRCLFP